MMDISFDFSDKVFCITGATSGIGKKITSDICCSGGRVIAVGRNRDVFVKLKAEHGEKLYPVVADLRDESVVEKIQKAISELGKLDGFVHAAGVSYNTPLRVYNDDKAHEIMDVSFWSAVKLIQLINKPKNHNPMCSYVLFSSVAAYSGGKAIFAYAAAKSAVQSLARTLCKEIVKDGSRINSISPGVIETDMTRMVDDKFGLSDSIKQGALLGLGSVEDVSGMVKFLMSDNAKWITGRDFVIDGGYLMGGRE